MNLRHVFSIEKLSLALVLLLSGVFYACFYAFLAYGFDITDEGFYLQSIKYADAYDYSLSKFGHVLRPLWEVSGGDLVVFRRLFWLIILMVAFSNLYVWIAVSDFSCLVRVAICLSLSSTAIIALVRWLPTPNYNLLALIAIVLFSTAIGLCYRGKAVLGGLLVSFSGVLAFLAKPTTAAALVIPSILLLVLLAGKEKKLGISYVFTVLLGTAAFSLLSAIFVSGSVHLFIQGLQKGFVYSSLMLGESWGTPLDLLWKGNLKARQFSSEVVWVSVSISLFFFLKMVVGERAESGKHYVLAFIDQVSTLGVVLLSVVLVVWVLLLNQANPSAHYSKADWLLMCWLPVIAILISSCISRVVKNRWGWAESIAVTTLLFLPYCYTLGTTASYWKGILLAISASGGLVVMLNANRANILVSFGAYCLALAVLVLPTQGKSVYRQPVSDFVLLNDSERDSINRELSGIKLKAEQSRFLSEFVELASNAGFEQNTPVIDLTGASPGVISVLNGKGLGAPWVLGGYIGSNKLAKLHLETADKSELLASWVLLENGPRSFSPNILNVVGLELNRDFIKIGETRLPAGLGGRRTETVQELYKPRD